MLPIYTVNLLFSLEDALPPSISTTVSTIFITDGSWDNDHARPELRLQQVHHIVREAGSRALVGSST
jgi:hypothetical protein